MSELVRGIFPGRRTKGQTFLRHCLPRQEMAEGEERKMKDKAGSVTKYITKTGERLWRYRFDGDPINVSRNVISKQGFKTRGAAMDALRIAIDAYRQGKTVGPLPPPPKETVADWVRAWLRDYAPQRCSPKTIERYHQLAGYILNAMEGEPARLAAVPLVDVDHVIVETALYALLRAKAKRREHLSPKTIREIASVLSVSLNKAFRLGKINVNPLLRVELPKVERSDARALTLDEVQRLRDACRNDWTFTFIEIALATGARRGELLALEWSDIDWLGSVLQVTKSLEQTAAGLRIKRPKNGKARKLRVGQSALSALRFQQEQQAEHRRLYEPDYKGDLVFCHQTDLTCGRIWCHRRSCEGCERPRSRTLRYIPCATRTQAVCSRKASHSRRSRQG
jgi:integrase